MCASIICVDTLTSGGQEQSTVAMPGTGTVMLNITVTLLQSLFPFLASPRHPTAEGRGEGTLTQL